MEGRLNERTKVFEVFYKDRWVALDENIWDLTKRKISLEFLTILFYAADVVFKGKAFGELKRRIKYDFELKSLWIFFMKASRPLGDLALNEIFDRSGKLYVLSNDRNR